MGKWKAGDVVGIYDGDGRPNYVEAYKVLGIDKKMATVQTLRIDGRSNIVFSLPLKELHTFPR